MEKYDYRESMINDIIDWFVENEHCSEVINGEQYELFDKYYEDLWLNDSVTGNASGSYYYNRWKAEEALCHNFDLYLEATKEFGMDKLAMNELPNNPESADVTIRCYLLGECLVSAIERMKIGYNEYFENNILK